MGLLDQFKAYIDANTPRSTRPAVSPQNVIYAGLLQKPIENIKANAAGLLGEIQRAPQDLAALASPQMYAKALKAMNTPQPVDKQKWIDAGMELSGMAPVGGLLAHTVYHGSPHKFDKFDMSKIGTGEGAQAYGHGLYFAESLGVAKSYQDLAKRAGPQVDGTQLNRMSASFAESSLANMYQNRLAAGLSPEKAAEQTAKWGASHPQIGKDIADSFVAKLSPPPDGNLYKVDIPDEAIPRMLDWDKPLSEQTAEIQALATQWNSGKLPRASMTGDELLRYIEQQNRFMRSGKKAEEVLKEAGIPGIKYLDGSSRNAGQGTSNFVLFDDQLPRILEVNGQPTGLLSYADEAARKPKPKKAK